MMELRINPVVVEDLKTIKNFISDIRLNIPVKTKNTLYILYVMC